MRSLRGRRPKQSRWRRKPPRKNPNRLARHAPLRCAGITLREAGSSQEAHPRACFVFALCADATHASSDSPPHKDCERTVVVPCSAAPAMSHGALRRLQCIRQCAHALVQCAQAYSALPQGVHICPVASDRHLLAPRARLACIHAGLGNSLGCNLQAIHADRGANSH